ncbi:MAG: helix-turn-helix transcriptional regulator [Bacteroidetes bacterium]|nr:helix-turn-helix transcriptional regulator [Bacteroidota bacterium]
MKSAIMEGAATLSRKGAELLQPSNAADQQDTAEWRQAAVERVIRVMRERLDNPLTLDEMAEIAHLSRFHFNRVFGGVTGVSPRKFLATLRLEYAKKLLLTTRMSITDVCFETGFSSLGTFTTHFTRLVGVTPRKWRRLPVDINMSMMEVVRLVAEARARVDRRHLAVKGSVAISSDESTMNGVVFVGVFEQQIPEALPLAGDLLFGGGNYFIPLLPDGVYYVLAVAIPLPLNPMDFFLPEMMLRDRSPRCAISNQQCVEDVHLNLRAPRITDPPILIALPFLFAAYLGLGGE